MLPKQFVLDVRLRRETVPAFDAYPFDLPVVRALDVLPLHPNVTFLVGENGSGKSTLLEAIAVAWGFNAEGGSTNFNFGTRPSHSPLADHLRLAKGMRRPKDGFFLRAESFFNVATEVERLGVSGYGARSLHAQSHGESFFALMTTRFRGNGFYVLDEPEAALSPQRQLAALTRFHQLVAQDSQFVIATHSPILLAYPGATIYQLSEVGIERVDYDDAEPVTLTRAFLGAPERFLRGLLAD